jgi:hypothetical protein
MADNGNGTFKVGAGNKSVSITGPHIINVLLILVVGGLGYGIGTTVTTNQKQGLTALTQNQATLVELVHTNRQQMEAKMEAQNNLLAQQTARLEQKVDEHNAHMETKFVRLFHQHDMLNYNNHREASDQLPLDAPVPQER